MSSSSTTSIVSSSTSSPQDSAPKDPRITAVIVVLVLVALVLIALVVTLTIRVKRRTDGEKRASMTGPFHGTTIWEREHPASQISPFGAPRSTPRFDHQPGNDMRIAHRRPDGAWHFADPRTPFRPVGVSDIENTPSPSPIAFTPLSTPSMFNSPFSPHFNFNNSSTPSIGSSSLSPTYPAGPSANGYIGTTSGPAVGGSPYGYSASFASRSMLSDMDKPLPTPKELEFLEYPAETASSRKYAKTKSKALSIKVSLGSKYEFEAAADGSLTLPAPTFNYTRSRSGSRSDSVS
ncbi:hypothetical protein FA15DRAFT_299397 [Coprinopsis marcescibilis]|uniref:Uncharacterized protein n=1 Tax=Coprinopsis marcescibilis TaxID=230819 RepID=A0A5C3L041_COPMA|nr:hypothetical protein FA15DRAFT_299397 [Coprinopsis marcescibilis]